MPSVAATAKAGAAEAVNEDGRAFALPNRIAQPHCFVNKSTARKRERASATSPEDSRAADPAGAYPARPQAGTGEKGKYLGYTMYNLS